MIRFETANELRTALLDSLDHTHVNYGEGTPTHLLADFSPEQVELVKDFIESFVAIVTTGNGMAVIDVGLVDPPDAARDERRRAAYAAIDSEREYQNAAWPDGNGQTVGDFITLLDAYVHKARMAWIRERKSGGGSHSVRAVRKVAGIATRCMEVHGAPMRDAAG